MARTPLRDSDPPRVGSYQLLARLGAGGMGVVYLASGQDGRPVALKVLRPEMADVTDFRHLTSHAAQRMHVDHGH